MQTISSIGHNFVNFLQTLNSTNQIRFLLIQTHFAKQSLDQPPSTFFRWIRTRILSISILPLDPPPPHKHNTQCAYIMLIFISRVLKLCLIWPSSSPACCCSAWSRLKLNTKIGLNHHHQPTTNF